MDYQNYLYLEYRRTIRKFRKLQTRFEKRISKDTFQDLTARRRYKVLTQLRKLKQKIEQLTSRLKLAAAGGSLAFSMAMAIDANGQEIIAAAAAAGPSGTPKSMTVDKTLVNDATTGAQTNPDVAYNNEGNAVVVWQDIDDNIYGKGYGDDIDNTVTFEILNTAGATVNEPVVALNDEDEFIVAWAEDDGGRPPEQYEIKYMRYVVEDGVVTNDGPYTAASGANAMGEVDVALDESGNFVIAWQEEGASYDEIKAKYYNSSNASNGELAVSQNTSHDQISPSVDLDNEGNFIVVWKGSEGSASAYSVINARKYNQNTPEDDAYILESASDYGNADEIKSPDVDLNGDGSFVVAWEYEQNVGSSEYIRAQIYDQEGSAQVDGDIDVGVFQLAKNPKIAADKDGGFVVVYDTDDYSGNQYINGSRYNRFGDRIQTWNFYNEGYSGNVSGEPAIGMNDRGDFIVAWEDNLSSVNSGECTSETDCDSYGIYFKRFEGSENPPYNISDSEMINTFSTSSQVDPAIAKDGSGNYVVVWESNINDETEQGYAIRGQRYFDDGSKNGSEFQINTITTDNQIDPDVAMNANGDFIVTWRGGFSTYGVYARMYNADGSAIGDDIKVDDETGSTNHSHPAVDINDDGDAIILYTHSYSDVLARRINSDGTTNGDEFKVEAETGSGARNYPDVALNNDGSFVATFGLRSGSYQNTYYRRFDNNDTPLDPSEVKISEGSFYDTRRQSIALDDENGDFTIAYTEYYDDYSAVKVSKFSKEGSAIFEKVELTDYATNDFVPQIDMNSQGEIAVAWEEPYDGAFNVVSMLDSNGDIFIEYYYPFGTSSTGEDPTLIVNDDSEVTVVRAKSLDIYGVRFAQPLDVNIDAGEEFIVNGVSNGNQDYPDIAQNENGDFVVVWRDQSGGSYFSIRAQRYNEDGIRVGAEMEVSNSPSTYTNEPAVALNDNGNFMIIWSEYGASGGSDYDIVGNVFDWDGNNVKDDFVINVATTGNQDNPDIALNNSGGFQVIWSDQDNYSQNAIIAQNFSADGTAVATGNVELVGVTSTGSTLESNIATNDNGDIAIAYAWAPDGVLTSELAVYNSSYTPQVEGLTINDFSDFRMASVIADENGDFILAWEEYESISNTYQLMTRRYSGGTSFATEAISIAEITSESEPSIAAVDDGDFTISYTQYDNNSYTEGIYSTYIRRISSELKAIGPEIQVNDITASYSYNNAIASSPDGSFTVVWESNYADNSGSAVMAKQFISHKPTVEALGMTLDEGAQSSLTSEHLIIENPAGDTGNTYITFVSVPENGTLTVEGAEVIENDELGIEDLELLTYTHDGSETTADAFSFTVSNENFTTSEQDLIITINPVNDAPVLAAGIANQNGTEDVLFELTLSGSEFSDAENDELTYSASQSDDSALPEWLSFNAETATFSGTPTDGGEYAIKVTASDGEFSVSDEFALSVSAVNDTPALANGIADQETDQYDPYSFAVPANTFSDVDGDDLTLSASLADDSALPSWLSFASGTSTLSGTPGRGESGEYDIKITATDGSDASVSTTFKLTVNFVLSADESLTDVNFYPNPAESSLNLRLDERMHGAIDLIMYNQSGRMVRQMALNKIQSSQIFEIDVQNLRKGIYLVKLVNENTTSTFKINKK